MDTLTSPLLAQTCCWMLSTAGPIFGQLTLHAAELRFTPAPGEEEHRMRLPRSRLLGSTVTPIKQRLMVQTAERTWWFIGPGVGTLGRRLSGILNPRELDFAADEQLLASAVVWCGPVCGEAMLTDRRLMFHARGAWGLLARLLGRPTRWEAPRAAVRHAADGTLQVTDASASAARSLSGSGVLRLAAHLEEETQLVWPARWRSGWRKISGVLVLGRGALGLMARGRPTETIALEGLKRLQQRASHLRLEAEAVTLRISAETGGLLLRELARAFLELPLRTMSPSRQPVLWWRQADDVLVGTVRSDGKMLTFMTTDGAVMLHEELTGLRRSPGPPTQIRLSSEQRQFQFEPPHHGGLVEHFWQNYDPPERIQPWPRDAEGRKEMLSGQRSVWLSDRGQYEIQLQPGLLLEMPDGFGVVLPSDKATPAPGCTLTVELGREDGIYQLDAELLRLAPLPGHLRFPRTGTVAVFRHPEDVRYYNQRNAFRVAMKMAINAWRLRLDKRRNTWIPDGDRLSGRLYDLSITGCGLHTDASVNLGEHLFLEMLIGEHWLPLEAECVRVEPGWPEGSNLGLQFLNLPERLEQLLSQTIHKQQRGGAQDDVVPVK